MRMKATVAAVVLASFTGATGYCLGATADRPVRELSRNASVNSDNLVSPDSFSEVERVTAMLDAK